MKLVHTYCAVLSLLILQLSQAFGQYETETAAVLALGDLTEAPSLRANDTDDQLITVTPGNTTAVYFDSVDYEGSPTRVYAYLGIPSGASSTNKAPAMVLVHGGGGKAFDSWVEKWTAEGFAAISIDTEGQGPDGLTSHAMGGPMRTGIYNDSADPIGDQFMYHACAATILANSLLRSLPEVDPDKIGVMGVSWGGVITSTVVGLDDRFAFAIPTYGCGDMHNSSSHWSSLSSNELYKQVWDPMLRLDQAAMPIMWFSYPEEIIFPIDTQLNNHRSATSTTNMVCLKPGMGHGHALSWNQPDSYAFAEGIVNNGEAWCILVDSYLHSDTATAIFKTNETLDQAELVYTTDTDANTGNRTWLSTAATLIDNEDGTWTASSALPTGVTAYYINVLKGSLVASSDYRDDSIFAYASLANFALGKSTSQSSTFYSGLSSRAVDGNTSGAWTDNSVTHTEEDLNASWEVDLGSDYRIQYINIHNRTDCCSSRLSDFTVSVINSFDEITYLRYFSDYPDTTLLINTGGVIGNQVKIELNGTGVLSIAEVEVYGKYSKYNTWISEYASLIDADFAEDPEGDGIINLFEFILGGDPENSNTLILPTLDTSGEQLVFTFSRRTDSVAGRNQIFQYSSNLENWTDIYIDQPGVDDDVTIGDAVDGVEPVTISISSEDVSDQRLFGRLKTEL